MSPQTSHFHAQRVDAPHQSGGPHGSANAPTVAESEELRSLLEDEDAPLSAAITHIDASPALARAVRRAVNSLEFGLLYPVERIPHAVTLLGRRRLQIVAAGLLAKAAETQAVRDAAAERFRQSQSLR